MHMKQFILSLSAVVALSTAAQAQSSSFCEGVHDVLKDAPNDYRNILGRMMESTTSGTMWSSTVKIPGVVGYRIVSAMGYFYEGAFIQTTDKNKLKPLYDEYTEKLKACLAPDGYKLSYQENFIAGLSDFRKVIFMKDIKPGTDAKDLPPHVTMEALYNKDIGKFALVMFIFNH